MAYRHDMIPAPQLEPFLHAYGWARAARRRTMLIGIVLLLGALAASMAGAEVRLDIFWDKIGNFGSYFDRLAKLDTGDRVWTDPVSWFWGWRRWSLQLGQTLLIAYIATITGAAFGLTGGVLASRNISPFPAVRFVALRVSEFARTVPDIVFALIFVVAFGLGPLPGVLAVTLHTAGTLGKLLAEVIENIDMKPVEGVQATGGNWLAQVRFGVLPQILPNFASYVLLRLEINVRGAAVIGFVGAGGIGQELIVAIRKFYYSDVSAMLLMLLACVVAIDFASERVRSRLQATERDEARPARQAQSQSRAVVIVAAVAVYVSGLVLLDMSPVRIWRGLGQLSTILMLMLPPSAEGHFGLFLDALGQTLSIAFLGTLLAGLVALPFGFLAARNVVANRLVHALARRSLDTVRSIDALIWALIWINVVGLGPFAGALAIACSDVGALAKLFSESIEAVDRKPIDGVLASGGGRLATIRFGIVPQVLPVFASQLLYFFESNTRSATIIGIVGAGGIGLYLYEQIRVLEWQQVGFLILMVLLTVAAIDVVSRRLRQAMIGHRVK